MNKQKISFDMSSAMPKFFESEFFVPEVDNWHLKEDAPEEVRKEFEEWMKEHSSEDELDSYLQKYSEQFNENFPVFLMMGTSKSEIIRIIQTCLCSGTPFVPETIPNADY